jgi:hypothetical protein
MNLREFFESDLHKRIIKFFRGNPASIDTPRGTATWVGYKREEARRALEELAKAGIQISLLTPSTPRYAYTRNSDIIKEIERLI